jgi:hypothetical protein
LLQPFRTYFHFYKKGFLNSQAVRIRVKVVFAKNFLSMTHVQVRLGPGFLSGGGCSAEQFVPAYSYETPEEML